MLVAERERADEFEKMIKAEGADAKASANWLINVIPGRVNKGRPDARHRSGFGEGHVAIVKMIASSDISGKIAKDPTRSSGPKAATRRRSSKSAA
ncbi:MAG: hypothetical protein R3D43_14455 [Tepidamorphaceae bacterium]